MTKYKKGNKYHTMTEFAPVVEAALKAWPDMDKRPLWFKDSNNWRSSWDIDINRFPMELTRDVPDGSEVKPLTVDEIRKPNREVFYISPDSGEVCPASFWLTRDALISRGLNCYDTKADCQRANGLEVTTND